MNKLLLNTVIQDFIYNNLNGDITKLLFGNSPFENVTIKDIVSQIEAKKKCKTKLPTWFSTLGIYYPNKIHIEQTSSERTALYKSQLVSGKSLADITGGFGVDAYFFAKRMEQVTHLEINEDLSHIASHNLECLKIKNVNFHNTDGLDFLEKTKKTHDWIYVDPSRRHDVKGKVFFLKDCLPNVPEHLEMLFKFAPNLMIKTAPLLDISAGLRELKMVKEIHVVAIDNEVKELLWILQKNFKGTIEIKTVNLTKTGCEEFSFYLAAEKTAMVTYSEPLTYLYEPNAAVLKSGSFKLVSERLKVNKLHKNTHLYTSDRLLDFPGRTFKIDKVLPYSKKRLIKELGSIKANVSIRNFPETVHQLKEKFNLKDGGASYLFFTTDCKNQKKVLICSKV